MATQIMPWALLGPGPYWALGPIGAWALLGLSPIGPRYLEVYLDLVAFMNTWDHVRLGMRRDIDREVLHQLFHTQIKGLPELKMDMAYYDRVGVGHEDHTYEWLYQTCRRYIARTHRESIKKQLHDNLGGTWKPGGAAGKGKQKELTEEQCDKWVDPTQMLGPKK